MQGKDCIQYSIDTRSILQQLFLEQVSDKGDRPMAKKAKKPAKKAKKK
jgi:hypothetical protein